MLLSERLGSLFREPILKLRNPPVVEAWIEFHMRGSSQQATWPEGLKQILPELTETYGSTPEQLTRDTFQYRISAASVPEVFDAKREVVRVRLFDGERRRCVQIGNDELVVNLVRGGAEFEGLDALTGVARTELQRYISVFRPESIRSLAVHYTDIVRIPIAPPWRLEDYFNIGITVPADGEWPLAGIALECTFPLDREADHQDHLILSFKRERPGSGEERFRMDWHVESVGLNTLDVAEILARVSVLREELRPRFQACFTKRAWDLFEKDPETADASHG
jgi:uncharacterized protein (TIGR04255 family)